MTCGDGPLQAVFETHLDYLQPLARGKVRDIYNIDADHMLIVTTDRLSAFDVVLPDPIPGKGIILTEVSNFWFSKSAHLVPNHLANIDPRDYLKGDDHDTVAPRSIVVRKLKPLPVEAIVRGYLIGSGWKDYQNSGQVCGIPLEAGLQQAQQLPDVLFTPSTKAEVGDHDINISFEQTVDLIGLELAKQIRDISIQLYQMAAEHARQRGIIIADTKFEFGLDDEGKLILIDEALTPDSSRFWPVEGYQTGISPPSFDKQFVRDYLETLDWNKTAPGPRLPEEIILKTRDKYAEALLKITS